MEYYWVFLCLFYQSIAENKNRVIETTEEELQGFFIIKSILAEKMQLNRIFARDTKSYFGVLLDDNNRKWICRLLFNTKQKYLALHIEDKKEEKFAIENIEDIYKYKNEILSIIDRLDNEKI